MAGSFKVPLEQVIQLAAGETEIPAVQVPHRLKERRLRNPERLGVGVVVIKRVDETDGSHRRGDEGVALDGRLFGDGFQIEDGDVLLDHRLQFLDLICLGGRIEDLSLTRDGGDRLRDGERALVVAVGHQLVKEERHAILAARLQELEERHPDGEEQLDARTTGELDQLVRGIAERIEGDEIILPDGESIPPVRDLQQPLGGTLEYLRLVIALPLLLDLFIEGLDDATLHRLLTMGFQRLECALQLIIGLLQRIGAREQALSFAQLRPLLLLLAYLRECALGLLETHRQLSAVRLLGGGPYRCIKAIQRPARDGQILNELCIPLPLYTEPPHRLKVAEVDARFAVEGLQLFAAALQCRLGPSEAVAALRERLDEGLDGSDVLGKVPSFFDEPVIISLTQSTEGGEALFRSLPGCTCILFVGGGNRQRLLTLEPGDQLFREVEELCALQERARGKAKGRCGVLPRIEPLLPGALSLMQFDLARFDALVLRLLGA